MRRYLIGFGAVVAVAASGAAIAQQASAPSGYLGRDRWPDAAKILPPPPSAGSAEEKQQLAVYRALRKLEGTPRWALAQNDVPTAPQQMLANFSCSVGAQLTPQNAPKTMALIGKAGLEAGMQVASVKDVFKRPRPYQIEDGVICTEKSPQLAASPDYPSGHATYGWLVGLMLANAAPDRATPILVRARAFGESRVVCGVHSPGAVEAGRTNAGALFAVLQSEPRFRADLEAVRAEIAAARAGPPPPAERCASEAEVLAKAPY